MGPMPMELVGVRQMGYGLRVHKPNSPSPDRVDNRLPGIPIHYRIKKRDVPNSLVVLMPAAMTGPRKNPGQPYYARATWTSLWPGSDVLAFADPAVHLNENLNGAWFIHPDHDVLQAIADVVRDYAIDRNVPVERIVFYGSSLGGYGAIGAAACLRGSRAVSEIPQIEFTDWGKSAQQSVEKYLLRGPLDEFIKQYPERVSSYARCEKSGFIPPIRLLTNPDDMGIEKHQSFFAWANSVDLPQEGHMELVISNEVSGHRALSKETIRTLVLP